MTPSSTASSQSPVRPNPSLEWTATGKPLGPRTGQCHHPLRGPSAFPASAPSAQTLGRRGHSAGFALATQLTAIERETVPASALRQFALASSQAVSGVPAPGFWSASASALCCRGPADQSVSRRRPRLSASTAVQAAISRTTQHLSLGRRGTWGPSRSVLLSPSRRPNWSLERDLHRHGTWPARRCGSSSVARAKRHAGVGPSAQTLGPTFERVWPRAG